MSLAGPAGADMPLRDSPEQGGVARRGPGQDPPRLARREPTWQGRRTLGLPMKWAVTRVGPKHRRTDRNSAILLRTHRPLRAGSGREATSAEVAGKHLHGSVSLCTFLTLEP